MPSLLDKINSLGYQLPPCPKPAGSYVPLKIVNGIAFLSGQLPRLADGKLLSGRLGESMDVADGKAAARAALLNALSILENHQLLDRVEEIVRLTGFVQCTAEFKDIPQVVNGASDALLEIFGEKGRHARSAVGMFSLPADAAVEIELTVKLKGESS